METTPPKTQQLNGAAYDGSDGACRRAVTDYSKCLPVLLSVAQATCSNAPTERRRYAANLRPSTSYERLLALIGDDNYFRSCRHCSDDRWTTTDDFRST